MQVTWDADLFETTFYDAGGKTACCTIPPNAFHENVIRQARASLYGVEVYCNAPPSSALLLAFSQQNASIYEARRGILKGGGLGARWISCQYNHVTITGETNMRRVQFV